MGVLKLEDVNYTYDKQGDFSNEIYSFDEATCKDSLDSKRVFAKFRGEV